MYTLRFTNSYRPTFPKYERSHSSLDSVALEILRVREQIENIAAYTPIVEDADGEPVHAVPTAVRRREVRPVLGTEKLHSSSSKSSTITGHKIIEVTEIDGRYVSSKWLQDV